MSPRMPSGALGRRRWWYWVAAIVLAVITVPAATDAAFRAARPRPPAKPRDYLPIPSGARLKTYRVRQLLRVPWGVARGHVALWQDPRTVGRSSVVAYAVGDDGGVWLVDYPGTARFRGPRAQRFDRIGTARVQVPLDLLGSLMSGTPNGDLYYDIAADAVPYERVRRLDRSGRVRMTYPVPTGLYLTGTVVSPDGGVFGRTEQWDVVEERNVAVLQPMLTYLGDQTKAQAGAPRDLLGYRFVPTGELAEVEQDIAGGAPEPTRKAAQYFVNRSQIGRGYTYDTRMDWVGGDARGNVYLEVGRSFRFETVQQDMVGQLKDRARQVAVFDRGGRVLGVVSLPWQEIALGCRTGIYVDAGGRIYLPGGDGSGFILWVAEPVRGG